VNVVVESHERFAIGINLLNAFEGNIVDQPLDLSVNCDKFCSDLSVLAALHSAYLPAQGLKLLVKSLKVCRKV
jgi:hypothetical protein